MGLPSYKRFVGMRRIPVIPDISKKPNPFILSSLRTDFEPLKKEAVGSFETSRAT
jgi:hypothetical protein